MNVYTIIPAENTVVHLIYTAEVENGNTTTNPSHHGDIIQN